MAEMKLAIMQPYLFPYIGYFQLVKAVDRFVFYDDVNYIRRGWINRNQIMVNGQNVIFTVPLDKPDYHDKINQVNISQANYPTWAAKFLKTLEMAYKKAPFFEQWFPVIQGVINLECSHIDELCRQSILKTMEFLDLKCEFIPSSGKYENDHFKSQARILDICDQEGVSTYINMEGGMELYDKKDFAVKNLDLKFLRASLEGYPHFKGKQSALGLSIIDVLMFNDKDWVKNQLNTYTLL